MPSDNNPKPESNIKIADLFAGIGGIRLGFERAASKIDGLNLSCVFSSEWDKFAQQTYEANFGEIPFGDITAIDPASIPDINILCGGFPCQPFSIAGISKKKSLNKPVGFDDKAQGNLFFNIAEIIWAKRPEAFFLENVKNLENHDKGNTFRVIQQMLTDELGYSFSHKVINAKYLVPQNRERVYMVGFRDPKIKFDFPEIPDLQPKLGKILLKKHDPKYILSDHLWQYLQDYAEKHRLKSNGFGFGLANINGCSRTLSARYYKDGSEILISRGEGKNPRRLTPRECARLQGFPDRIFGDKTNFKIPVSDTQAYKQFGNSVSVPVIERIADSLLKQVIEMGLTN
jgi:DNA (cytosine-5)-methyltransferase 1